MVVDTFVNLISVSFLFLSYIHFYLGQICLLYLMPSILFRLFFSVEFLAVGTVGRRLSVCRQLVFKENNVSVLHFPDC